MRKTILLACGLALELLAIGRFEKKLNEKVKKACEYYGSNTPEEAINNYIRLKSPDKGFLFFSLTLFLH